MELLSCERCIRRPSVTLTPFSPFCRRNLHEEGQNVQNTAKDNAIEDIPCHPVCRQRLFLLKISFSFARSNNFRLRASVGALFSTLLLLRHSGVRSPLRSEQDRGSRRKRGGDAFAKFNTLFAQWSPLRPSGSTFFPEQTFFLFRGGNGKEKSRGEGLRNEPTTLGRERWEG